jgi:hypothetical protein
LFFLYPASVKRDTNLPPPFPEKLPARLIKFYTLKAICASYSDELGTLACRARATEGIKHDLSARPSWSLAGPFYCVIDGASKL